MVLINEAKKDPEEVLNEAGLITDSEKNLRSKIDSIIRSIENLSEKKARIDFEIKKQKKSLIRKRIELKRVVKSTRTRSIPMSETQNTTLPALDDYIKELQRNDSIRLEKSDRILNQD